MLFDTWCEGFGLNPSGSFLFAMAAANAGQGPGQPRFAFSTMPTSCGSGAAAPAAMIHDICRRII